jgi:hypothetical protein
VYDATGHGAFKMTVPEEFQADPEEEKKFIAQTRADQKELNAEYRKAHPARYGRSGRKKVLDRAKAHTNALERAAEDEAEEAPIAPQEDSLAGQGVDEAAPDIDLKLDKDTGNSTVLMGSSKAGKSTLMMHLFLKYYAGKEFVTTLFAENVQIPLYTGPKKKKLVLVNCYEPGLIKMAHFIQRGTDNHYRFCFMLDDIVDKRDDKALKKLVLSLRNSDMSSVVSLQFTNLLAKNSRANVNNILLFRFNSQEAIELAIAQFLKAHFRRMGIEPDAMVDFYKKATADHGFIYLHPASDSISFHRLAQAET